jgi:tetratricopeptide (TPR) repeat protein
VLPVSQITARLDNVFRLLMGGARTVMPRHQTLRATIDWSYTLLSPQERLALQRLAVFSGGWTLTAAEAVCSEECDSAEQAICPEEVLDLLASLVDKSLVILTDHERGDGRYRMLETIRQYARDRLLEAGGGEAVRDRHLHYYLALAEDFDRRVRGPEQVQCLDAMESELDNLRLALEWSLVGHVSEGLRLAGALKWFWHIPNKHNEGRQWLERLLTIESEARGDQPLAMSGQSTGHLLGWTRCISTLALLGTDKDGFFTDDPWQAMLEQNVQLCSRMGDIASRELVHALLWRGIYVFLTDPDQCIQLIQQGIKISREKGFRFEEAELMFFNWMGAYLMGNIPEGQKYLESGLAICQQLQDVDGIATRLSASVVLASYRGEHAKARALFEEGVHYYQRVRNMWSIHNMAVNALLLWPDPDRIGRAEHALAFFIETQDDSYTIMAYYNLMYAEWSNGNFERVQRLADQGLELFASRKLQNNQNFGIFFLRIARLALSLGDEQKAQQNLKMSLPYFLKNNPVGLAAETTDLIDSLAVLFAKRGAFRWAVQVLGAIEDTYQHFLFQILPRQRSEHDEALRAAREALGEEAYNAAWQAGCAMTLAQALEYGVAGLDAGGE